MAAQVVNKEDKELLTPLGDMLLVLLGRWSLGDGSCFFLNFNEFFYISVWFHMFDFKV